MKGLHPLLISMHIIPLSFLLTYLQRRILYRLSLCAILTDPPFQEESGKGRLHLLQQKLKISFSKPRLEAKVDELRKYNGDLRVLAKQITRLKHETELSPSATTTNTSIVKFETVRKASQKLYEALSSLWACKAHDEHSANICLDVGDRQQVDNVRFNMALTYIGGTQATTATSDKPLWLTVESLVEQSNSATMVSNASLPIRTLSATLQNTVAQGESVSFALSNTPLPDQSSNASCPPLDLCSIKKDLCLYFQERLQKPIRPSPSPCIGFLQKTQTFKHFIYPCNIPHQNTLSGADVISLNDALMLATSSPLGIPLADKFRIAKLLALAALQFHATPWLQDSWRSRDVLFFGIRDLSSDTLHAPYLNARFVKASTAAIASQQICSGVQTAPLISRSLAPNRILYSLGIMLIELGFDAPLQDLQLPEDLMNGLVDQYTEFWTAKRLGLAVSNRLGTRYGRVVQKCLNCDFGIGGDYELESKVLQCAVFQDVVRELDRCLQSVRIF